MAQKVRIRDHGDLAQLEEGDLVEFERGSYSHWAVYRGDEQVVHLTGIDGHLQSNPGHVFTISGKQYSKAAVKEDNIWDVAEGSPIYKNNTRDKDKSPLSKREIVGEAVSRIGQVGYNLLTENCEHFAKFCRYGEARSDQVRDVAKYAAFGAALGAGAVLLIGKDKKE